MRRGTFEVLQAGLVLLALCAPQLAGAEGSAAGSAGSAGSKDAPKRVTLQQLSPDWKPQLKGDPSLAVDRGPASVQATGTRIGPITIMTNDTEQPRSFKGSVSRLDSNPAY